MKLTDNETANARVNVALILIDVADSLLIDAEPVLHRHSLGLSQHHKINWRKLIAALNNLRSYIKICSKPLYECEDSADAIADADEWKDTIELILDRIGDERKDELFKFLKQYDSLYGITDKRDSE